MISRNDSRSYEINPDSLAGLFVGVCGEEFGSCGGVGIFEEFADHGAFVEWLVVVL